MNAHAAIPSFGVAQRFMAGDYRSVESVIEQTNSLHVARIRTPLMESEFSTVTGRAWYEWLVPALATKLELLPSLSSPLERTAKKNSGQHGAPLGNLVDGVVNAFGAYFETAELWINPKLGELDPHDRLVPRFADELREAIALLRSSGKQVVLGGAISNHRAWLELLGTCGLLREISAVGLQGSPSTADLGGSYWPQRLTSVRDILERHGSAAEIWITETGFPNDSTLDRAQFRAFLETVDARCQRFYWHSVQDNHSEEEPVGLFDAKGKPRLLARQLSDGGTSRVRELLGFSQRGRRHNGKGVALITGGAGFIGTNLAARLLSEGRSVRIFDNLSRPGTENNLRWLAERYGERLEFRLADVRDRHALREAVTDATEVFHFAAQVAVTTSLIDPLHDFEINGRGTLNLLEELRRIDKPPPLLFTSTNKVYGGLDDLPLHVTETRYELADPELRARGIDESRNLTFCSPYGCSKGASDQYVLDFARTFHLPAAVLRMSCIYGPHQFGTEDQGWVAHFARQALAGEPIVIYGDGRQVRDILFVEDLVDALLLARDSMESVRGQAFNLGGGPQNTVSLRELILELGRLRGTLPEVRYEEWRASDQRYYVSDVSRFKSATGWAPHTSVREGVERMTEWMVSPQPVAPAAATGRAAL